MKNDRSEFITLQGAAILSGKAEQTIRRAIKAKKLAARKQKTPQGFTYSVDKAALMNLYRRDSPEIKAKKSKSTSQPTIRKGKQSEGASGKTTSRYFIVARDGTADKGAAEKTASARTTSQASNRKSEQKNLVNSDDYSTMMEFQKLLRNLVEEHSREREHNARFLHELRDKIMFLEHQVMQLQAPKKRWWKFW